MTQLFSALFFAFIVIYNPVVWLTDFNMAKIKAKEENKNILIYFSGSDWCKPCIQLKNNILDSEEFSQYINENYVLIQADFPRLKKNGLSKEQEQHNEKLAEKYNSSGEFPLLVIIDSEGVVIKKTGYNYQSVEEFVKIIDQSSD